MPLMAWQGHSALMQTQWLPRDRAASCQRAFCLPPVPPKSINQWRKTAGAFKKRQIGTRWNVPAMVVCRHYRVRKDYSPPLCRRTEGPWVALRGRFLHNRCHHRCRLALKRCVCGGGGAVVLFSFLPLSKHGIMYIQRHVRVTAVSVVQGSHLPLPLSPVPTNLPVNNIFYDELHSQPLPHGYFMLLSCSVDLCQRIRGGGGGGGVVCGSAVSVPRRSPDPVPTSAE